MATPLTDAMRALSLQLERGAEWAGNLVMLMQWETEGHQTMIDAAAAFANVSDTVGEASALAHAANLTNLSVRAGNLQVFQALAENDAAAIYQLADKLDTEVPADTGQQPRAKGAKAEGAVDAPTGKTGDEPQAKPDAE